MNRYPETNNGSRRGPREALAGHIGRALARGSEILLSYAGDPAPCDDIKKENEELRRLQGIKLAGSLAAHPTLGERAQKPDSPGDPLT